MKKKAKPKPNIEDLEDQAIHKILTEILGERNHSVRHEKIVQHEILTRAIVARRESAWTADNAL